MDDSRLNTSETERRTRKPSVIILKTRIHAAKQGIYTDLQSYAARGRAQRLRLLAEEGAWAESTACAVMGSTNAPERGHQGRDAPPLIVKVAVDTVYSSLYEELLRYPPRWRAQRLVELAEQRLWRDIAQTKSSSTPPPPQQDWSLDSAPSRTTTPARVSVLPAPRGDGAPELPDLFAQMLAKHTR